MKKIFFTLVIGVLCLTMAGCGSNEAKLRNKAENLMDRALNQADKMMNEAEQEIDKQLNAEEKESIYGYYVFESDYTNSDGSTRNLKATLSLNFDGSAAYTESDGLSYESTRGVFEVKDGKVTYTREYYYYKNDLGVLNTSLYDGSDKTKEFVVIDKNTIQSSFKDLTTMQLKK